jgi:hypothetical protein
MSLQKNRGVIDGLRALALLECVYELRPLQKTCQTSTYAVGSRSVPVWSRQTHCEPKMRSRILSRKLTARFTNNHHQVITESENSYPMPQSLSYVVSILNRNALRHVVDLIDPNKPFRQLKHVVA